MHDELDCSPVGPASDCHFIRKRILIRFLLLDKQAAFNQHMPLCKNKKLFLNDANETVFYSKIISKLFSGKVCQKIAKCSNKEVLVWFIKAHCFVSVCGIKSCKSKSKFS